MTLKKKTHDEIEAIAQNAIEDAVSFVSGEISPDRVKAQRYYDGEVDISHETGRSKVIATKVRDVVRAVKPSLMRVFLSSATPVEFMPKTAKQILEAEQATKFISSEFDRLGGFSILTACFQDALVKKQGIAKAYWCDTKTAKIYTFSNLTDQEVALIVAEDDVTVIEHDEEVVLITDPMTGEELQALEHSVKVSRTVEESSMVVEAVPPEEFFISRGAKTIKDAYCTVHRTEMPLADLMAMGFDYKDVEGLGVSEGDTSSEEEFERQGFSSDDENGIDDDAMKPVTVTEAYMRIDVDGTGVPILHKILCAGAANKMLDYEPVDEAPFSKFETDPEPHAFYGPAFAELIMDDQDAATSMLRGILDNIAMVNNPRLGVVEGQANMEDVLNNEIGAVIRLKSLNAMVPIDTPFTAGQTLGAMQYYDEMVQGKTGVSRASMGLDANALQTTTRVQAQATVQAGAATTESMVRNLAVGVANLFGLMLRIYKKNTDEELAMQSGETFVPVDPRIWADNMPMRINVGLGTGGEEQKMAGLSQALQLQMQVFQAYGPSNGVVSLTNIRNTVTDMLAINGLRNADRYFMPMDAEKEQQLMQQAQQAQQGEQGAGDPNAAFLQSEQMKVQQRMQEAQTKAQLDAQKLMMSDDLDRDKMAQDFALKQAELQGKFGLQADAMLLKAEQERQRQWGQ